jgi:hypothetical protein
LRYQRSSNKTNDQEAARHIHSSVETKVWYS